MKNLLRNIAYASIIVAATTITVTQMNRPAEAQIGTHIVAATTHNSNYCGADGAFITNAGDVYRFAVGSCVGENATIHLGNVWSGGPIAVEPSTWSQIKAKDWKPGK